MRGLAEEKRHSPVGQKQRNYISVWFNSVPHHSLCGWHRGAWGGVSSLAQRTICHPARAGLILIPDPARPSRPAVSSPQKGFLLGGEAVLVGEFGETKAGRELQSEAPLTWWGRRRRQTAPCLLLLLFYQAHRPQGLTERKGEGGGANEHNEQTDTDYPSPPLLHPFIFG